VPEQNLHAAVVAARCKHTDIGRLSDAARHDLVEIDLSAARRCDLLCAESREQSEHVEYRQIDPMGRELAVTREPGLIDKGERPSESAFERNIAAACQSVRSRSWCRA
jgi:hypothetical protein